MKSNISRRNFISLATSAVLSSAAFLTGCTPRSEQQSDSSESSANTSAGTQSQSTPKTGSSNSLIVVYSWSGNTLEMAERLQELEPEAGFFNIVPEEAYPNDYEATADRAKQERDEGVMVPYQGDVEDWDSYDTIYLGYPIWWYELPQAVKKFISDHDWSGKTIYPFNSHEGSGDGGTPADIAEMATGATVGSNLAIRGGSVSSSLDEVNSWHAELQG